MRQIQHAFPSFGIAILILDASTHNLYETTIQSRNINQTPAQLAPNRNAKFTKSPAHLVQEAIAVTCYFKHLKQIFEKAGITVTSSNRAEVDRVIHNLVGVNYKNCPAAWKQVKTRVSEDEANFVLKLKDAWENRKNYLS
jgi:hypothetical protein